MLDNLPNDAVLKIYAIGKLECNDYADFPLSTALLKTEQDGNEKLQERLGKPSYKNCIGTMTFGNITVHTIVNKIAVPSNLK